MSSGTNSAFLRLTGYPLHHFPYAARLSAPPQPRGISFAFRRSVFGTEPPCASLFDVDPGPLGLGIPFIDPHTRSNDPHDVGARSLGLRRAPSIFLDDLRDLVGLDEANARLAHLGVRVFAGVHDEKAPGRVGVDEAHRGAVEAAPGCRRP